MITRSAGSRPRSYLLLHARTGFSAALFLPVGFESQKHPLAVKTVSEALSVSRALGVTHCVADICPPPEARDFVWQESDDGRVPHKLADPVLTMRAARQVEYSIFHPRRPVFDPAETTLAEVIAGRPVFLVADGALAELYRAQWTDYARRHLHLLGELLLPVSERSKVLSQVDEICRCAERAQLPRHGLVVAVGGGVTLDLAGFAASMFRRGVPYLRIPTTLVGLVDVSIGIKQGVNAYGKKNLLGAFYPPVAGINDYRFLRTLPPAEVACGMAEIVKISLLGDPALFDLVERHGPELVASRFANPADAAAEIALSAERLMLNELSPNLFEAELARLVDFGHTFSPAIEAASGYRVSHGQAVALDMLLSTALASLRGQADPLLLPRLCSLLPKLQLPVHFHSDVSPALLWQALEDARRHRGGSLNLVALSRPGRADFLQEVSLSELEAALKLLRSAALSSSPEIVQEPRAYARAAV